MTLNATDRLHDDDDERPLLILLPLDGSGSRPLLPTDMINN